MKKSEEDQKAVDSGELWESFKKTQYYKALSEFMSDKIIEYRDIIVQASMEGEHEKARDIGQQLAGFRQVTDWIDGTIYTRAEILESEKEKKDFEKQLPHRL